jgi:hypothetical protein
MFWNQGASLRELFQWRCTNQTANECFVHLYKHN